MAWSVLQSAGNAATAAVTMGSNVSAGSKLIAYIGSADPSAAVTGVTDNLGNSFNLKASVVNSLPGSYTVNLYVYALDTPAGLVGTKPTITAATSAGAFNAPILVQEVSGLAAEPSSLDGTFATSSGLSSSAAPGAYSSTAANEFLVDVATNAGNLMTGPAGYTQDPNNQTGNTPTYIGYANSSNGAESGTYSIGASTYWCVILGAFALPSAPPATDAPPPFILNPPGRQSPTAFQFLANPVSYETATGISGTVQPAATRLPRRTAARAVWKGFVSATTNLLGGTTPDKLVVARRTAARAVWKGFVSSTTNRLNGNQPGGVIYRRKAARAYWRGFTSATTNLLSGNQPDGVVYRRKAARAVVHGNLAPFPPPIGTVPDHLVIARRAAARAVWRGFTSTTTNLLYGNPPGGLVRRRTAARATWAGTVSRTVNAAPSAPVSGTAPDHLVVARRNASRAVWRGFTSTTVNFIPPAAAVPHPVIPRRVPARALWRGGPVPGIQSRPQAGGLVRRRSTARVLWHGNQGSPAPAPSGSIMPGVRIVIRRPPSRGQWHGITVRTTNALPVAVPAPKMRPRVIGRGTARAIWRSSGPQPFNAKAASVISIGQPFTDWGTDLPFTRWQASKPFTDWETGLVYTR